MPRCVDSPGGRDVSGENVLNRTEQGGGVTRIGGLLSIEPGGTIQLMSGASLLLPAADLPTVAPLDDQTTVIAQDDVVANVGAAVLSTDGSGGAGDAALAGSVNARLMTIDENFSDLTAKVNAIIQGLIDSGVFD